MFCHGLGVQSLRFKTLQGQVVVVGAVLYVYEPFKVMFCVCIYLYMCLL